MKKKIGVILLALLLLGIGWFCFGLKGGVMRAEQLNVTSPSFKESALIPIKYTCQGDDVSPAIQWEPGPKSTKSFVLLADDPDAPKGTWVHWIVFNIPATVTLLPENVSIDTIPGALEGTNSAARVGYMGPCPPDDKAHRYYFKIYALDMLLDFNENITKVDLEKAIDGHVIAQGYIMGRYQKQIIKK